MKKIGILTIHRIYNHGSFLQAFALKTTIENILSDGTKCELMDWPIKEGQSFPFYEKCNINVPKPYGLKFWLHKKMKHATYCRDIAMAWQYQRLGELYIAQCQKYLGVSEIPNYRCCYDLVVVGSDESFNCTQDDAVWDALYCFNLRAQYIISYACSFGYSTLKRLHDYKVLNMVKEGLHHYKELSVRDDNSRDIVYALTDRTALIHLDPVLVFDYSDYMPNIRRKKDFILVYNYLNRINDSNFIQQIRALAKREGLKIISVFEYCPWADENLAMTSFEVLSYFKKAKYVITDTFHGTVMSIKFNKRFVVFVRESNFNKLYYLLQKFGLENQIIKPEDNPLDKLFGDINWDAVNERLALESERTKDYLRTILKNI